MAKREAKSQKAAWKKALAELRIVNFNHGERFTEYKTADEASHAVVEALKAGMPAKVAP